MLCVTGVSLVPCAGAVAEQPSTCRAAVVTMVYNRVK